MLTQLVVSVSIALQFAAAIYALLLIKVTGKQYAWILISVALFLMGIRRLIPLYYSIVTPASYPLDLTNELIGLSLSLLMLLGVIGIGPIFNERKQIQKRLHQYSQELEKTVEARTIDLKEANSRLLSAKRLATIGELAGMVGHDLRNPLAAIKNATYLLKKKSANISETDAKAMIEIIEKGIDHSDKIICNLQDYSGEIHLKQKETGLRNLLIQALAKVKIPEKITIMNNIPSEISIKIDPDKIECVFVNISKNAIDAMPNGGTFIVKYKQVLENVEISFADTGVGIPEEILPKIFNPLFTTKAQGMGFGLAISKRIVEAHGGKIIFVTSKGEGTTFTVTLPLESKLRTEDAKVWVDQPEPMSAINDQ